MLLTTHPRDRRGRTIVAPTTVALRSTSATGCGSVRAPPSCPGCHDRCTALSSVPRRSVMADVEPNTVVAGVPARVVRRLDAGCGHPRRASRPLWTDGRGRHGLSGGSDHRWLIPRPAVADDQRSSASLLGCQSGGPPAHIGHDGNYVRPPDRQSIPRNVVVRSMRASWHSSRWPQDAATVRRRSPSTRRCRPNPLRRQPANDADAGRPVDTSSVVAPGPWVDATGNLAGLTSECGTSRWCGERVTSPVWRRTAYGPAGRATSGQPLGHGPGSAAIDNRRSVDRLRPEGPHDDVLGERRLRRRACSGRTTADRRSSGSATSRAPTIVSVDFTDDLRQTLVVGLARAAEGASVH